MWKIVCLIAFISEAKANLTNLVTDEEETTESLVTRLDDPEKEASKGLREEKIVENPNQAITSVSVEGEKPSSSFLGRNETSSAPGSIQRAFDIKYLDQKVSFPVAEAPWWERWWFSVKEWWSLEVTQ